MPSVFTQIISNQIPSFKLYEDDLVMAILAKDQIRLGHTLIVPKIEIDNFSEVPEPYYSAVFQKAQSISKAILSATDCLRVGLMVDGREIPHFHLHLVPLNEFDKLSFDGSKQYSKEEMVQIQQKILDNLEL
jgi:histidine triad (HIT) family protein